MDFERFLDGIAEEGKRQKAELACFEKWLKCVCAFANEEGGILVFDISEGKRKEEGEEPGGTPEKTQISEEKITPEKARALVRRKVEECIEPSLQISLRLVEKEEGESFLLAEIPDGREKPYYYTGGETAGAYVRAREGGIIAGREELRKLVFRGAGASYDSLSSGYASEEVSFSEFVEYYQEWTGKRMTRKKLEEFGMTAEGRVTNAGLLFADVCPVPHSRMFCTRWRGTDKSMGQTGIQDSEEYSGNLVYLLNRGVGFVKRNMKTLWRNTKDCRTEMPDYCDISIFEGLVNALAHRDYRIRESEIHVDMFDDRLMIYSPGGMPDGTRIQDRRQGLLLSVRRNPVVTDIFQNLGYMEKRGSGLNKIRKACRDAANYSAEKMPEFYSDDGQFTVILKNMNYEGVREEQLILTEKEKKVLALVAQFPTISTDHISQRSEIAKRTVERTLQSLKKKGIVIREGSRRSGYWRVVEKVV